MSKIELKSEVGVDYTELRDLLAKQKWLEADLETLFAMMRVSKAPDGDYVGDMNEFPCADLITIDQLWRHYSSERFGFTVQKQLWRSIGGSIDSLRGDDSFRSYEFLLQKFSPLVGWKKDDDYLNREDLIYSLDAPAGQLPAAWVQSDTVVGGSGQIFAAWVRLETCGRSSS